MRLHAVLFAPIWLPARSFVVMTEFRLYDAGITGRQPAQARKAVSLVKTLVRFPATFNTEDLSRVSQANFLPKQWIQIKKAVTNWQLVVHWISLLNAHLPDDAFHH